MSRNCFTEGFRNWIHERYGWDHVMRHERLLELNEAYEAGLHAASLPPQRSRGTSHKTPSTLAYGVRDRIKRHKIRVYEGYRASHPYAIDVVEGSPYDPDPKKVPIIGVCRFPPHWFPKAWNRNPRLAEWRFKTLIDVEKFLGTRDP
jgi:hypothetical protein